MPIAPCGGLAGLTNPWTAKASPEMAINPDSALPECEKTCILRQKDRGVSCFISLTLHAVRLSNGHVKYSRRLTLPCKIDIVWFTHRQNRFICVYDKKIEGNIDVISRIDLDSVVILIDLGTIS